MEFTDDILTVDRTDAERAEDCPQMLAYEIANPSLTSHAAAVGIEAHEAISQTIESYIVSGAGTRDIQAELQMNLLATRPDMLPDTVEAMRPSLWRIANILSDLHPGSIERFDGGRDSYSGQLARDLRIGNQTVRITSELDLLTRTPSPECLDEYDWKSGHTTYSIDDIARSFQFGLHAALVFDAYPAVQELRVRVLRTRYNELTRPVSFTRADLPLLDARIMNAAARWLAVKNGQKPEKFPTAEKCGRCRFSPKCWKNGHTETPPQLVDQLLILDAAKEAIESQLKAIVGKSGEVRGISGAVFGTNKPKADRTTYGLY